MGFMNGLLQGLSKGVTGGDHTMELQDYLKLAGVAAAGATGNVPALVALGAGMAGDATGSDELALAGDVASMATGVGGLAGGLGGATGAVDAATGVADAASGAGQGLAAAADTGAGMLEAADAAGKVMSPLAENAQLLEAGNAIEGLSGAGAGAAGNVYGGADIAGQMGDLESFVGPIPPSVGQGPSKFKLAVNNLLGDNSQQRAETIGGLAEDAGGAYTQMQEQQPEAVPLEWQQTEDATNYTPTTLALKEYMAQQQGGNINPYTSQFAGYPYGG